jgi:protein N-terminal methyltransferase
LIHNFDEVDLVEPVKHFIRKAEELLSGQSAPTRYNGHKAVNFFAEPLESFTPEAGRYDVIWVQWCVGHLTDDDFEAFFRRCAIGLKPGGMIYVKENNVKDGFVLDTDDSSLTRSHKYFTHLFEDRCGFEIVKHKLQTKFPQELFQVRMYAVRPRPAT